MIQQSTKSPKMSLKSYNYMANDINICYHQ